MSEPHPIEVDDIFEEKSDANHVALEFLAEVLREVGFNVRKKKSSESTLQVYPAKYRVYPLLNPRLYQSSEDDSGFLEINVHSKSDSVALSESQIGLLQDSPQFEFNPRNSTDPKYICHGVVVIRFEVKVMSTLDSATFPSLIEPLKELHRILTTTMTVTSAHPDESRVP